MTCIFCEIVAGYAPSHVVWEDSAHLAFLSIFPNTPGFTVIATKHHYQSYAFSESDQVLAKLVIASKQVGLLLDRAFQDVARTGFILEGFGVDHLHAKLFPMHGTAPMETWKPIRSKVDKFFTHYEGYLSSHDYSRADDLDLTAIAAKIRQARDQEKSR